MNKKASKSATDNVEATQSTQLPEAHSPEVEAVEQSPVVEVITDATETQGTTVEPITVEPEAQPVSEAGATTSPEAISEA